MKNRYTKVAVVTGAALLSVAGPTFAQVDLTAPLASIADAETGIVGIGTALIGLAAVALTFKWLKAMFFG